MPEIRKPRRLQPGDAIAVVAPASGFRLDDFDAGLEELRALGFDPKFEASVFERSAFTAGTPEIRAEAFLRAWADPDVRAIIAVRGGYGSAHLLPLLRPLDLGDPPKAFIGYSDNTALMSWLTTACGVVTFHGPMIEGRLAKGSGAYDRDSFLRCLTRAEPLGSIRPRGLTAIRPGTATGPLVGGTMTQLAASLGTPYAFRPPDGCVLFLDEVGERLYRVHRLFTQLVQAGIIAKASAIVFNELPRCTEAGGSVAARDAVVELTQDFSGPVLFGFPSGHTDGAAITLPFGVRASVEANGVPAVIIEEAAVV